RDPSTRAARIEAGLAGLEALEARLVAPRSRLRTRVAAEEAAAAALEGAGATRWVRATVTEETEVSFTQERRGRPGAGTRYRRSEKAVFHVTAAVVADTVAYDARGDGCFPLHAAYRYQPNLERRHHVLKGPQEVAPVYLETPHRIEALLTCHFFAQLTEALIEREIRTSMREQGLPASPSTPSRAAATPPRRHASSRSSTTSSATA
ncbi:MAG: IS1634 family transposase, partial [Acidimicrobiales bacterium]